MSINKNLYLALNTQAYSVNILTEIYVNSESTADLGIKNLAKVQEMN